MMKAMMCNSNHFVTIELIASKCDFFPEKMHWMTTAALLCKGQISHDDNSNYDRDCGDVNMDDANADHTACPPPFNLSLVLSNSRFIRTELDMAGQRRRVMKLFDDL